MIERLRCRYVRAVILLFSVTRVEKGAAQPKHIISFSDEHVVHKKDSVFWEGDIIPTRIISPSIIESQSNENDEEGISWKILGSNLFSNDDEYDTRLKENRLCDIGDGYVYREGEKLETFDTRCGSIEYFPCYCDPDLEPPISCPYCGFHSTPPPNPALQADANANRKALSNSDDFFCLKSGETSGPFLGSAGSLQVCSCTAKDFQPVSTCAPPKTQVITVDDLRSDDDVEEGNEDDVQAQAIPNNNNSNNPSFTSNFNTNPNSNGGEEDDANDEAAPGYSITYNSYIKSNSPSLRPSSSKGFTSNFNTSPNNNGGEEDDANDEATPDYSITYNSYIKSNSPSSGPSPMDTNLFIVKAPSAFDEPAVREPLKDQNVVSNNDIDLPSKRTVPINKSAESNGNSNGDDDVCTLVLEGTGETKIFQRGESYGSHLPSECSRPEDFPCFCNPDLVDQAECPHCGFLTDNGIVLCAHHDKTVSFRTPGGGGIETCTCLVSINPAYRPIEACTVTSHTDDRSERSSGNYQDMFESGNGGNTAAHNIGDETGGDSDGTNDGDDKSAGSSRSNIDMGDPGLKFSGQQEQLLSPQQPPAYSPVVIPIPPPPTFVPSIRAPADYYSSGSIGRNTVGGSFVVFGTMISTVVWMLAPAVT